MRQGQSPSRRASQEWTTSICRKRPRQIRNVQRILVSCLFFLAFLSQAVAKGDFATCAPPSSSQNYDWEAYNYYQILDLPQTGTTRKERRHERAKIQTPDIRKAYRKQAQLYHPDKRKANQTSVEESNSRFARIAEAYEVLSDSAKRLEYDAFLLDCEDHLAKIAPSKSTAASKTASDNSRSWSFFENLSTDPRRVFEEFFFGASSSPVESTWEDVIHENGPPTYSPSPHVRVSETRQVRYDPFTGAEMLTILQTEEHPADANGRSRYRVTAQDFVEQYDRFYGWGYVPVTKPYVVEEGYKESQQRPHLKESNTLMANEYLTPDKSKLLTSSNGRYYAGLTPECELLILSDSSRLGPDVEDFLVWSSGTYVPPSHNYGCFLGLRGPHLVLALGTPDRPGSVLWYSDVSDSVMEEEERIRRTGGPAHLYFARLDDDGNLVVYRQDAIPRKGEADKNSQHEGRNTEHWWSKMVGRTGTLPRTRAAKAWVKVMDWTEQRILGKRKDGNSKAKATVLTRDVCIYATGPAGCNTPGRKLVHIAADMSQSVKHKLTKIDNAIDVFVESLSEDEDDDIVDTIFRILTKAGSGIGRAAQRIARKSAKTVRDMIQERFYIAERI